MSNPARLSLHEIFEDWPAEMPGTLVGLADASPAELRASLEASGKSEYATEVLALRALAIDASHAEKSFPIANTVAARQLLEQHILRPTAKQWTVWALDENFCRAGVREGANLRYYRHVSWQVPAVEQLRAECPLGGGVGYFIVYGGSPQVLDDTADELARLLAAVPVIDVLFWSLEKGKQPALFSLRGGLGSQAKAEVQFPNPDALERASRPWR